MKRIVKLSVVAGLFLHCFMAISLAQHEPAVRISQKVCRDQYSCSMYYGNGVIIGRSRGVIVIATAAHVIGQTGQTAVKINGNWLDATIGHLDKQADFGIALVRDDPSLKFKIAQVAEQEPPIGADVRINGYSPGPFRFLVRPRRFLRFDPQFGSAWLTGTVVSGVSGSGVEYQGKLAGIVSAVPVDSRDQRILIVPVTVIQSRLKKWGYILQKPPPAQPPIPGIKQPNCAKPRLIIPLEPPVSPPAAQAKCDCQSDLDRLESNLQQLTDSIVLLKSSNSKSESEIELLKSEISKLQSAVEKLLTQRREVVLLNENGEETARKSYGIGDPIILRGILKSNKEQ